MLTLNTHLLDTKSYIQLRKNGGCKRPVVTVAGCVDTVLTVDTVGVVNGVVVTVLSVVTGAVVAVVVNGTVGVVSDSVVTAAGVVVNSVNHSCL